MFGTCLFHGSETERLQGREDRWVAMLPMNQFGNQLWMLASTHGIAKARRARWCVVPSEHFAKHLAWVVQPEPCPFLLWNLPLLNWAFTESKFETVGDEAGFARYTDAYVSAPGPRILAHGHMQSYKYFDGAAPVPFRLRAARPARMWVRAHRVTAAIHVRRGDKLWDLGNVVPPVAYYELAIATLRRLRPADRLGFVVLSDDPAWVRAQAAFAGMRVLSSDDASFDMAVMSHCRHKILSIGTFGWWGAFLGDAGHNRTATVLYPIPQMEGRLASGFSNEDYFPPHWTSVDYGARPGPAVARTAG
jgi:galactoside 2-L-fucosyltransferase 1/2